MEKGNKIGDPNIAYKAVYRDIKFPRIELKTGNVVLVLPKEYGAEEDFVSRHREWISKKVDSIEEAMETVKKIDLETNRTEEELRTIVHHAVETFSDELETNVERVFFRRMRTKWGSCSPNKNLTINTLLRYLPTHLIKYVIYHEIAHTIERKHTEKFWRIIKKRFRNSEREEKELLAYWFLVQKSGVW